MCFLMKSRYNPLDVRQVQHATVSLTDCSVPAVSELKSLSELSAACSCWRQVVND